MSDDLLAELTLIDLSRCQREALERWMRVCIDAGALETAADCREAIEAQDMQEAA